MVNLSRKKLLIPFCICMGSTLIIPALYPEMRLFFLCPFLVMNLYRNPLLKALITAFLCGLFLGLFSFESRLGVLGVIFVLTSLAVYPLKPYFFADRLYTLPLMTTIFSAVFTLISGFAFFSSVDSLIGAFLTEGIIMPFGDALYAFAVFVLPAFVFRQSFRLSHAAE